jgi:hypothetical protein
MLWKTHYRICLCLLIGRRYDKKEKREGAERKPSYIITLKRFWVLEKPVSIILRCGDNTDRSKGNWNKF